LGIDTEFIIGCLVLRIWLRYGGEAKKGQRFLFTLVKQKQQRYFPL
jgi:hypothetical protein